MEAADINALVDVKVKEALKENNRELLDSIGTMVAQISSPINTTFPTTKEFKFKRKSNEEQYKQNARVLAKIEEAEAGINTQQFATAKQSLIEAKDLVKRRQKLVQLADASELGWKVVAEYETNPIASDSDDERRIFKAEARASRKDKASKAKKRPYRQAPYSRPGTKENQSSSYVPAYSTHQRPGLCFHCGKSGHWKKECPQRDRSMNNKISVSFINTVQSEISDIGKKRNDSFIEDYDKKNQNKTECTEENLEGKKSSNEKENKPVSPAGRLKKASEQWKKTTDSCYIIDVVENGYKLPFKELPKDTELKNNKSARDNPSFVEQEIQYLLQKEIISEVSDRPKVVNPLTVAYNKNGKPRLVLDCRHINPNLHLFKIKFEDIKVAMEIFDLSSYIFTFDLKSAYHHIDIFPEHRTYLGFAWKDNGKVKYYVYNSLAFGLATAGHIFTKMLRTVIKYCRNQGNNVIMFLDDGIGGHVQYEKAKESSAFVKETLIAFGFLLANEKCNWTPLKIGTWLGHVLNFEQNKLYITNERIARLESSIDSLIFQIQKDNAKLLPLRYLASVTGQIVSLQSVLGKVVCRMTRFLHKCIDSRIGWNSVVMLSEHALAEIMFWKQNVRRLNSVGKMFTTSIHIDMHIYTDASSEGYGGYIVSKESAIEQFQLEGSKEQLSHENSTERIYYKEVSENTEWFSEMNENVMRTHETSKFELPEVSSIDFCQWFPEENKLVGAVNTTVTKLPEESCLRSELPEVSQNSTKRNHISPGSEMKGSWSKLEQTKSSTWRELEAMFRMLSSNTKVLRHKNVKFFTDNQNITYILEAGIGLNVSIKRRLDEAGIHNDDDDIMVKRMATQLLGSRADGTVNKYYYQVQAFKAFCENKGYISSPAKSIHVAMYLSEMISKGKSVNVITSAFYGIKWLHSVNGLQDPTEDSFVKNIQESAKRLNSKPVVKKEVVSSEHLIELCDMFVGTSDVIVLRDLSMILLSYAGFLRFSEVSELKCNDITFYSDHLVLKIRKSKTDIYRSGKDVFISKGTSNACPYEMLKKYLSCSGLKDETEKFLFQPGCRSGSNCFLLDKGKKLSYTRARECIIQKLKLVAPGLHLGTHSLRASGATVAANAKGVSERCLKRHGRWRSDSAKDGYVEDSVEKKLFITKQLKL